MSKNKINENFLEACSKGRVEEIINFLQKKCDIDYQDPKTGFTGVMLAAKGKHIDALELLFLEGADPYIKGNKGESVLSISEKSGDENLPQLVHAYSPGGRNEPKDRDDGLISIVEQVSKTTFELEPHADRYCHKGEREEFYSNYVRIGITYKEAGNEDFWGYLFETLNILPWEERFTPDSQVSPGAKSKNVIIVTSKLTNLVNKDIRNYKLASDIEDLEFITKNIGENLTFYEIAHDSFFKILGILCFNDELPIGLIHTEDEIFNGSKGFSNKVYDRLKTYHRNWMRDNR